MDLGLNGKVAVVTAASRGLGFAAAMELAREGANIAICSREKSSIEKAAAEIEKATGVSTLPVVTDVKHENEISSLISATVQHFGQLDILVTNAGGPPAGYFDDIDDTGWLAGFELTMLSATRLIRAALPHMKRQQWGRVVNILSISVKQPIAGLMISNALRPALVGLAKSLADEVAEQGITVNNVCPGWTKTERITEIINARAQAHNCTTEDVLDDILKNIPVGRMGLPAELASVITFLCSNQAAFMTGATIPVDGGANRGLM